MLTLGEHSLAEGTTLARLHHGFGVTTVLTRDVASQLNLHCRLQSTIKNTISVSKMCFELYLSFPFPITPLSSLNQSLHNYSDYARRFLTASSFIPFQLHPRTVTK